MKLKILVLIIAALFLASCVAKENDSTSGRFLVINSLTGNDLEDCRAPPRSFPMSKPPEASSTTTAWPQSRR